MYCSLNSSDNNLPLFHYFLIKGLSLCRKLSISLQSILQPVPLPLSKEVATQKRCSKHTEYRFLCTPGYTSRLSDYSKKGTMLKSLGGSLLSLMKVNKRKNDKSPQGWMHSSCNNGDWDHRWVST